MTNRQPPLPLDIDDDITADKHEALPFPEDVSDEMKQVVWSMMKTNFRQRPQNVKEFRSLIGTPTPITKRIVKEPIPSKVSDSSNGEETIVENLQIDGTIIEVNPKAMGSPIPKPTPSPVKAECSSSNNDSILGCILSMVVIILICILFFALKNCLSSETESQGTETSVETQNQGNQTGTGTADENQNQGNQTVIQMSVKAVQDGPTDSSPAIQPISKDKLSKYNVVASSFSTLASAQKECQRIREDGYFSNIFLDSSNMYRVLIFMGTNSEQEAKAKREGALEMFPTALIMVVEHGRAYRYD